MLDFQLYQPDGQLADRVQGIWSAALAKSQHTAVSKALYSDAGSGILWHLAGRIEIAGQALPQGVILQPTHTVSETIRIYPGAQLAGVRFHPAVGFAIFGRHFTTPTPLTAAEHEAASLTALYDKLQQTPHHHARIALLRAWASRTMSRYPTFSAALAQTLAKPKIATTVADFDQLLALSQRQVERLFKHWLDLTPKHYLRIVRVKQAIDYLRINRSASLVDVALQFGFSDQAHMTREFRAIARTTPGKV